MKKSVATFLALLLTLLAPAACAVPQDPHERYDAISEGDSRARVRRYFGPTSETTLRYGPLARHAVEFKDGKVSRTYYYPDEPDWWTAIKEGMTVDQVVAIKGKPSAVCDDYQFERATWPYYCSFCYDSSGHVVKKDEAQAPVP